MSKKKVYVETTVLADSLIKIGGESDEAKAALNRYSTSQLPVYAIKEFKAGPLSYVSYLHSKLLDCGSYPATFLALSKVVRQRNRLATCLRLLSDRHTQVINSSKLKALSSKYGSLAEADKTIFDSLVVEAKVLVMKAWLRCDSFATEIVDDLPCYERVAPKIRRNGRYNLSPTTCKTVDCCMTDDLRKRKIELTKLVSVIKRQPPKRENGPRKTVLHDLAVKQSHKLTNDDCMKLGDAIFALYCPADADLLTTNLSDIRPLADALKKNAISPKEVLST